jgi:hypothetical protein
MRVFPSDDHAIQDDSRVSLDPECAVRLPGGDGEMLASTSIVFCVSSCCVAALVLMSRTNMVELRSGGQDRKHGIRCAQLVDSEHVASQVVMERLPVPLTLKDPPPAPLGGKMFEEVDL